ncbi:uncharacterized protein [Littorina saxatilis]|uniref:Uncharacterized protein n=1 Tax=Littorina saxatilis TaxID=31220 RepID=A0AAN9BWI1_9CAEN
MKGVVWMALFSTCLLGVTVDSVIIRDYRNENAKVMLVSGSELEEIPVSSRNQNGRKKRKKTFRPTTSRCCKIGYKVAKRKLSCDVPLLEVVRKVNDMQRAKMKYNRPRKIVQSKISAKLSRKLGECSKSYPRFFEKCCEYREKYYKNMDKCKKRARKERRTCRQTVRKRYKVTSKKGRKTIRKQRRSRGRRGSSLTEQP